MVYRRERLGQERVERLFGTLELGDGTLYARGSLRPRGTPGAHRTIRDHGPLPGPDRIQGSRERPRTRGCGSVERPACAFGRGAFERAGHGAVEGAARAHD